MKYALAAVILMASLTDAYAACVSIRNSDKRRECYAERDQRPSACQLIKDRDQRELCRVRAGRR